MVSQSAVAMGENPRVLFDFACVPCEVDPRQGKQKTRGHQKKNKDKNKKTKVNKRPKNLLRRAARKGRNLSIPTVA